VATLTQVAAQRYEQQDYSRPPGSIEVVLIRHGASEAAVEDEPFELLEGQADPALSAAGERQAQAVAGRMSPASRSRRSTSRRCAGPRRLRPRSRR
jgi:hypothetical protein